MRGFSEIGNCAESHCRIGVHRLERFDRQEFFQFVSQTDNPAGAADHQHRIDLVTGFPDIPQHFPGEIHAFIDAGRDHQIELLAGEFHRRMARRGFEQNFGIARKFFLGQPALQQNGQVHPFWIITEPGFTLPEVYFFQVVVEQLIEIVPAAIGLAERNHRQVVATVLILMDEGEIEGAAAEIEDQNILPEMVLRGKKPPDRGDRFGKKADLPESRRSGGCHEQLFLSFGKGYRMGDGGTGDFRSGTAGFGGFFQIFENLRHRLKC